MKRSRLRLQPAHRQAAAVVTVTLATAFVSLVILAITFVSGIITAQVEGQYAGTDVIVQPTVDDETGVAGQIAPADVEKTDGVRAAWPVPENLLGKLVADESKIDDQNPFATPGAFVDVQVAPPGADSDTRLNSGSMPSSPSEVLIDTAIAEDNDLAVGDELVLQKVTDGKPVRLTVAGIQDTPKSALLGASPLVMTSEGAATLAGDPVEFGGPAIYAQVEDGTDPAQVVKQLQADGFDATTTEQVIKDMNSAVLVMVASLTVALGSFVAIAVVTAALVVANTFAVTVAQRRRSFALLRALGATRGQVVRLVLKDSALVGLVGAVIGVVLAYLAGTGVLNLLRITSSTAFPPLPPLSILAIIVPIVLGVLLTVAAGLVPAISATKVRPVEALRPIEAAAGKGAGVIRTFVAVLLVAAGAALLAAGWFLALRNDSPDAAVTAVPMLVAILGTIVMMIGVIAGVLVVVPAIMRLFRAALGRIGGVPGRFAALNAGRHPRRSAATITALVIGTTLMATMSVGANTAERTLITELNSSSPFDVIASSAAFTDSSAKRTQAVDGVETAVQGVSVDVKAPNGEMMTILGFDRDEIERVSVLDGLADDVRDNEVLVGKDRAESFGLKDGDTLTAPDGTKVRVRVNESLSLTLTTEETVQHFSTSPETAVAARLAERSDPQRKQTDAPTILTEVGSVLDPQAQDGDDGADEENPAGLGLDMPGIERDMFTTAVNGLLMFATGMLAVAVLVALVGVMNTLSLSVVERRGENALLRALGTSKGQIRAMLAWEGVIMALVGAAIGLLLGTVFGVVGARTVVPASVPFVVGIPWVTLLAVVVLAILAGLLASVIPARSAAKVSPAEALAAAD